MKIKIMVDTKAKKVVFAEVEKEFVDFIFQLLTLPLATVVKLLSDKGMHGCFASVYKSVNSLHDRFFESEIDKNCVLKPKVAVTVPMLSVNEYQLSPDLFKCPTHNRVSFQKGLCCDVRGCYTPISDQSLYYVNASSSSSGFVKTVVPYMVMDDLEVKPLSISLIKEHVNDFGYLEEKMVEFGADEALEMLKASLETKAVLTTVFLGKDD